MTITWNIDEARRTIREQMNEANQLDAVIDDLSADLSAAERAREAAEAECERLRAQVAQAKVDGANEERSLHWMRENMELVALRKQVATLRTALAYYVEARNVTNWGMEEDEDIGDVARAALEATA